MIHGKNQIGFNLSSKGETSIQAINPKGQKQLPRHFVCATHEEADIAMEKAAAAFQQYQKTTSSKRADFLDCIADEILNLGNDLVQRAMLETALPEGRIVGERGRTINQLKLFASLLREGSWLNASIDTAIPDRQPLPKPDIRKMDVPVGPVVVFTASNFPLAFSTAGGDTASALAAGCPVVVKAHESHLGTNEMVATAISRAAQKCGMPDGVFSSLIGMGYATGEQLVMHPKTRVVSFTGSLRGGKAIYDMAQQRNHPIPVFAEMGSVNPVVVLPESLKQNAEQLGSQLAGSIALGVGQFCTNPGIIFCLEGQGLDSFTTVLSNELSSIPQGILLNKGISTNYEKLVSETLSEKGVSSLNKWEKGSSAVAVRANGKDFIENPKLHEEVFGPYSIVVVCHDIKELTKAVLALEGQLTASIMHTGDDLKHYTELVHLLESKVGRLIFNGVPTGVEVCYSMQHGGPFPASTDGRFTSVGTDAIKRFVRPLSWQDAPQQMLPDALKDENPLNIWRKLNGEITKSPIQ